MNYLYGKEILITGGTGSLGSTLTKKLLSEHKNINGIRIYSRDEFKQYNLKNELEAMFGKNIPVSFLIGDVRDESRLTRVMKGVNIVINTAAMKQVPACEYNPIEAVQTNINGAISVINASINTGVERVLHISTDKAVYPVNLYGATKAVTERLFLNANVYEPHTIKFSCCRYGNVLASRGSIIPYIKQCKSKGEIPLTDESMNRFFIHLDTVANFILNRICDMRGEEIFIPYMPTIYIKHLIQAIAPECKIIHSGIRDGEKLSEVLITLEESERTKSKENYYIIGKEKINKFPFTYNSGENHWLLKNSEDILKYIGDI